MSSGATIGSGLLWLKAIESKLFTLSVAGAFDVAAPNHAQNVRAKISLIRSCLDVSVFRSARCKVFLKVKEREGSFWNVHSSYRPGRSV